MSHAQTEIELTDKEIISQLTEQNERLQRANKRTIKGLTTAAAVLIAVLVGMAIVNYRLYETNDMVLETNELLLKRNQKLTRLLSEAGPPIVPNVTNVCLDHDRGMRCSASYFAQNDNEDYEHYTKLRRAAESNPFWDFTIDMHDRYNQAPFLMRHGYWKKRRAEEPSPPQDHVIMGGPY